MCWSNSYVIVTITSVLLASLLLATALLTVDIQMLLEVCTDMVQCKGAKLKPNKQDYLSS